MPTVMRRELYLTTYLWFVGEEMGGGCVKEKAVMTLEDSAKGKDLSNSLFGIGRVFSSGRELELMPGILGWSTFP